MYEFIKLIILLFNIVCVKHSSCFLFIKGDEIVLKSKI